MCVFCSFFCSKGKKTFNPCGRYVTQGDCSLYRISKSFAILCAQIYRNIASGFAPRASNAPKYLERPRYLEYETQGARGVLERLRDLEHDPFGPKKSITGPFGGQKPVSVLHTSSRRWTQFGPYHGEWVQKKTL